MPPSKLLHQHQRIEHAAGRPKIREKNSARTLDLDILYADDVEIDVSNLQVPHPYMLQRRFVIAPLKDIAPNRKTPGADFSFIEIYKMFSENEINSIYTINTYL